MEYLKSTSDLAREDIHRVQVHAGHWGPLFSCRTGRTATRGRSPYLRPFQMPCLRWRLWQTVGTSLECQMVCHSLVDCWGIWWTGSPCWRWDPPCYEACYRWRQGSIGVACHAMRRPADLPVSVRIIYRLWNTNLINRNDFSSTNQR